VLRPGPMTTAATSTPSRSPTTCAARTQASPPMPVKTVNRPCPPRSRVETWRRPWAVTQACGSFAPGREVMWE
jgi:hypothetical protein